MRRRRGKTFAMHSVLRRMFHILGRRPRSVFCIRHDGVYVMLCGFRGRRPNQHRGQRYEQNHHQNDSKYSH